MEGAVPRRTCVLPAADITADRSAPVSGPGALSPENEVFCPKSILGKNPKVQKRVSSKNAFLLVGFVHMEWIKSGLLCRCFLFSVEKRRGGERDTPQG